MTGVIRFCDVIENCEDCPNYGDVCDGRGDVCDGCVYKKNDMEEVCGNCKWNRYDWDGSGVRNQGGFYCGNEESENCGVPTFYNDTCEEWEEKDDM